MGISEVRNEILLRRAKKTLDDVDESLWPLMELGVATYGEFSWREGVGALEAAGFSDPEGRMFAFLDRDYVYRGRPVIRGPRGGVFPGEVERNHKDGLVQVFRVSQEGEVIADLVWPAKRDRQPGKTTFGYHK